MPSRYALFVPAPVLWFLFWLLACLTLAGCAAAQSASEAGRPGSQANAGPSSAQSLPESWQALGLRLEADNQYGADIDAILRASDPPSPDPMGRKIQELYRIAFPTPTHPAVRHPKLRLYPNVVTLENAAACRAFIAEHEAAFVRAETLYQVPRSIAAALLFVETRLGSAPGKQSVLHTLASMAASREPAQLGPWLEKLEQHEARLDWIAETMRKRSDWAYRELVAFLTYVRANNIDPLTVPGSIYGAMGICQFMPSNIAIFAVDGNDDGRIDLFQVDDAVASLSNYLVRNGWKPQSDRKIWFAALRRYNRVDIYANTILCLADLVRGEPVGQLVASGGKKTPAQKPGKKSPARKAPPAKPSADKIPGKSPAGPKR